MQLFYFFIFVASINNSMSIKCCLCFSINRHEDFYLIWGKAPLVSTCLTEKTNMTGQEFSYCAESDTFHHMTIILELLISSIFILPSNTSTFISILILFQGFFICHIINYTGYNQKWNVGQIRSAQWTVQRIKKYIKVTPHKSIYIGKKEIKSKMCSRIKKSAKQ